MELNSSHKNEFHNFSLNNEEWEQASHIIEMLNPLSAATELLCQLIDPAEKMFSKLNQYLVLALKKPLYVCAMIIDPRFKMHFWKSQLGIIEQHCSQSLNEIESIFLTEARKFYITTQVNMESQTNNQHQKKPKNPSLNQFDDALFCVVEKSNELEERIARYLQQDVEPKETKILAYWFCRQQTFPMLASMEQCFLGVPATSAPSERVFSKGRHITTWDCASLEPQTVQELSCVKQWYQHFGSAFFEEI
ncbi:uncharacterized protein VP01_1896g2 [Puccinia sorghi]|uniref:HAT C-terminal dimerisation domain-containing protein n=1 Tax=Puccinia sorghi TaxID=27349 RepID=A0A0L6VCY1_9BASI|nr:uncharacterized protein VP01_1896g2 [Puccinia sorghi]